MQEVYGGEGKSGAFLDRLETDLKKRERSKKELLKQHYSAEAMYRDPLLAKKMLDKDLSFINDYIQVLLTPSPHGHCRCHSCSHSLLFFHSQRAS